MKESGPQYFLGSKTEGEPIKVIKNYRGVNNSYGNDRTLVIKEGRNGKFIPPTSSLPEWFHPGYYDAADKVYLQLRRPPSAAAKVPFKNTGRYPSEEDDKEKTRKRLMQSRLNFLQTASLAGSQAPVDSLEGTQGQDSLTSLSPEYFYYSIYSKSASPSQFTRSSPRYASPSKCDRPHSRLPETGSFNPSNPWSSSSSKSTINSPIHHGHSLSPRTVYLSSSSCSSLPTGHHEGYIAVDDLNSELFDRPSTYRSSLSSLHSNTNVTTLYSDSGDRDVSLSTVDSVLLKAATREHSKYKVPDYTLGALDQQSISRLIIPPMEFPELDAEIDILSRPKSPASSKVNHLIPLPNQKTIKEKEKEKQQLESLYAVTTSGILDFYDNTSSGLLSSTTGSGITMKKDKNTSVKNKANQTLDSIKSSLSITKSSIVLDEEIPFDMKMTGYINKWTKERNIVDTDIMRPRQCITRQINDDKNTKKKTKNMKDNKKKRSKLRNDKNSLDSLSIDPDSSYDDGDGDHKEEDEDEDHYDSSREKISQQSSKQDGENGIFSFISSDDDGEFSEFTENDIDESVFSA